MTHAPLHRFFAADHRRLDALLRRSVSVPGQVDLVPFGEFRAGILKHIGMEEKVLFPAARHAREAPLALAARLRVDHGAIAALLVPTPTPSLVAELLSVLGPHNRREEEPGGVYEACDEAVGPAEAERLVQELRGFPEVPLKAYNDGPAILAHIQETLELSRRQWREVEGRWARINVGAPQPLEGGHVEEHDGHEPHHEGEGACGGGRSRWRRAARRSRGRSR